MVTNSVKELHPSLFANHRQMLGMDSRVVWNNPEVGSSMAGPPGTIAYQHAISSTTINQKTPEPKVLSALCQEF